jgi:hypothetical protein
MGVTFYKKTRKSMRKEDNLSNKCNQQNPTPRRKLLDYVGLTLKEYFANAGQKPSLKSSNKRPENYFVNKKTVEEGVFTLELKE